MHHMHMEVITISNNPPLIMTICLNITQTRINMTVRVAIEIDSIINQTFLLVYILARLTMTQNFYNAFSFSFLPNSIPLKLLHSLFHFLVVILIFLHLLLLQFFFYFILSMSSTMSSLKIHSTMECCHNYSSSNYVLFFASCASYSSSSFCHYSW